MIKIKVKSEKSRLMLHIKKTKITLINMFTEFTVDGKEPKVAL